MAAPQQQSNDNSLGILWVIALIIATIGFIWYYSGAYIVNFGIEIVTLQARFLKLFNEKFIYNVIELQALDPNKVTFNQFYTIVTQLNEYFRYPGLIFIGLCAYFIYKRQTASQFRQKYNMKSLAKAEAVNWPQIKPILGLDLEKQDVRKGPWAMALNPLEFVEQNSALIIEKSTQEVLKQSEVKIRLNTDIARDVLVKQLGRLWTGVHNLPPYAQGLFAAFAARINRDRENSNRIIDLLITQSLQGKWDLSTIHPVIQKHIGTKIIDRIIKRHAYELTVMASMLKTARDDGVLASSSFIWLKPIDRHLWYVLNSVGRQTPYVEVAAPFAHWIAELKLKQSIRSPMIDTAIKGLETALTEIKYKLKEDEED